MPAVPHLGLHVSRILVSRVLRGQDGEDISRVQFGIRRVAHAEFVEVDVHAAPTMEEGQIT